jgi:hypothetical protein
MEVRRTVVIAAFVLAYLILAVWLLSREPSWGFYSPFPFTVLRSLGLPLVLGIGAAPLAIASKSAVERRLHCSIVVAAVVEIVTIKIMGWLDQPAFLIAVLLLNGFMLFQILRYGSDHLPELDHRG